MTSVEIKVNAMAAMMLATNNCDYEAHKKTLLDAMNREDTSHTKDVESIIDSVLLEIGVPSNLLGHKYITSAILLCLEDSTYIYETTFGLYPAVAAKFDTTSLLVERGIRHAIESAWNRTSQEAICKYFGNTISADKGKPTNGEFISRVANVVKQRLN